jgi:hypothetical protein
MADFIRPLLASHASDVTTPLNTEAPTALILVTGLAKPILELLCPLEYKFHEGFRVVAFISMEV